MSAPSQALPIAGDLDATWNFIKPGLEFILGAQGDQGVTSKMYMNCYTAVYNYCTNKSRTSAVSQATSRMGLEKTTYTLTGGEIYGKLEDYLREYVQSLKPENNEPFLEFYVRKWKRFTIGARYLNNVFDYMNRYWVQKERSDGHRDIFDINSLALLQWKECLFTVNLDRIRDEVFELIERQRNNEIVDTNIISVTVKSMVYLGLDVNDLKKPTLVVYATCFENQFIEKTAEYYRKESQHFLSQHGVKDYMLKCENRFPEEINRSNNYLEERSRKLLRTTLRKVLIEDHAPEMYDQFLKLLEENETEHILRMFRLFGDVNESLEVMAERLETHIKTEASKEIEELKAVADSLDQPAEDRAARKKAQVAVNPKSYIYTLILLHKKFSGVVFNCFKQDSRFIKALDNACKHFVNLNAIATPTTKSASKTPDLLARYADSFLKATTKEAETENEVAENMKLILRYVENKDEFETHYRRLLAKRLINGNTRSDELEEGILQKLQDKNTLEYTTKITKMFEDMKSSEGLKNRVKELIGPKSTVGDFNPLILAQSMWPFTHNEDYTLRIAPELQSSLSSVEAEYKRLHPERNLQWLWNHGKNEVKANLSRKGKPPFIFTVSNVQLMILLAFNKSATYTFAQLHNVVGVSQNVFEAHLLPFVKFKLIEQNPPSLSLSDPKSTLTIVSEYKSKKLKVNFVSAVKNEQKQEDEEVNKEINEARKNYLSACIVRIMKARKSMRHNDLINEVLVQSQSRFNPKLIDIKRAIEYLLEKEYLARSEGDFYEYLA